MAQNARKKRKHRASGPEEGAPDSRRLRQKKTAAAEEDAPAAREQPPTGAEDDGAAAPPPPAEADDGNPFATMSPDLISDHLLRQARRYDGRAGFKLAHMAGGRVGAARIQDTTRWEHPRRLAHLNEFVERFERSRCGAADCARAHGDGHLPKSSAAPGSPHTVVVAMSGMRCADVVRELRKLQQARSPAEGTVAKLFAKHLKFEEQGNWARQARITFAVGTPQRVLDLMRSNYLSASSLRYVVVDASHADVKGRRLTDQPDSLRPLLEWLSHEELVAPADEGDRKAVKLLFY